MRPLAFRPPAAAFACLVALTVFGGCAADGPSGSRLDGLLLLAGDTTHTDLRAWSGRDAGRPIDVPDGTTWVTAGRAGVLGLGLANGTLRISDPIRSDRDPTWVEAQAALPTGAQAVGPFAFPVWDPDGGRMAAVAGDFDADPRLARLDPSAGTATEIDLGSPIGHAPPTWVGPDLVAIVTGTDAAPTSILVDMVTSAVTAGPSGARLLATSADGATLAAAEAGSGRIVVRSTKAWLDQGAAIIAVVDPPPDAVAAISMALDATGDRLAVAWVRRDDAVLIGIYDGSLEWTRATGPSADDAVGAVVAWFR
jgi:hypothetical protein